jgi:hypothetical protein
MTTYADVAAFARLRYLPALPAAAPVDPLHRPLGGALLARWFRRVDGQVPPADAMTLAAARAMLEAWCKACAGDESALVPPELEGWCLSDTARRALVYAMRDWQR